MKSVILLKELLKVFARKCKNNEKGSAEMIFQLLISFVIIFLIACLFVSNGML